MSRGDKTDDPKPRRRSRRAKELVVTSDLPMITRILPWENELLASCIGEILDSMFAEPDEELKVSAGKRIGRLEAGFRRACARLGVAIDDREVVENGDVILKCRVPRGAG